MKRRTIAVFRTSMIAVIQLVALSLSSGSQLSPQTEPGTIGIATLQLYSEHQPTKRGSFIVRHIATHSAAADAGIQIGDLILMTNGETVAGISVDDMTARLAGPVGTSIELSLVDVEGNQRKVSLVRKPYPPHVNPASDAFSYSIPGDWTMDLRYNFPLEWSPSIDHKGFEDLAFSPGFDDRESSEYHSYLIFWWLDGKVSLTAEELQREMVTYFRGLAEQRAKNNHFTPDLTQVTARYEPSHKGPRLLDGLQTVNFNGAVTVVDRQGKIVHLYSEVSTAQCTTDHTVVYFAMSKEPRPAPLWQRLDRVRDGFRCRQ